MSFEEWWENNGSLYYKDINSRDLSVEEKVKSVSALAFSSAKSLLAQKYLKYKNDEVKAELASLTGW